MTNTFSQIAKIFFVTFFSIFAAISAFPQRERNNIFLFDCTNSMKKAGLWQPALNAFDATIATQSLIPEAQFSIIPFGDGNYPEFTFTSGEYAKYERKIKDAFDNAMADAKNTHISPTLQKAFDKCDPAKDNRIFLLTDGKPNHDDSPEKVAALIASGCGKKRNTRLFYVALNDKAVDPLIEQAIDNCPDAYIVKCSDNVIPQIEDVATSAIHANIEDLDEIHQLGFSSPGSYPVEIVCNDPIFKVEAAGGRIENQKLRLKISSRNGESPETLHSALSQSITPGEDYLFNIKAIITDRKYVIANPDITIHMSDHVLSKLSFADGSVDEIAGNRAVWHDSFLWCQASEPGETEFDLAPAFSNATPATSLTLTPLPAKGQTHDFRLYFNGDEIAPNESFTIIPGKEARVKVVFNSDAQEGKRYFSLLKKDAKDLDVINASAVSEFDCISLRSSYDVVWNPLKTLLVWLGIIILAALVLWFGWLNKIFFRRIKAKRIIFTGPGQYYISKKIKGYREVVFTTKAKRQNFISRIFTGEIKYISAPHFIPEINVTAGSKRKIRLKSLSKGVETWDFIPSGTLSPYDKATAINRQTKEKFNIEVQ